MRIVDAQVHIWSGGAPSGLHRKVPSFTAEELLEEMDAAGVDAAVIHPPVSWDLHSNDLAIESPVNYADFRPAAVVLVGLRRSSACRRAG
jgi:predicted TIM-barrel fold metal-dependent hydrolase